MDLASLINHPHYPFRNFKKNDLDFLLLELYWAELFRNIAGDRHAKDWRPMFPADREVGNPILHLIDRTSHPPRSLRIIQRFNDDHLPEFDLTTLADVWFEDDVYVPFVPGLTAGAVAEDGVTPVEELVISSDVSPACERLTRKLVAAWCVYRVPEAEMRVIEERYWAEVNRHLHERQPSPQP